MPRKPSDTVVEYRITLGNWERERLGMLAGSKTFNNVAEPILDAGAKILTDTSSLLIILGAIATYLGFQFASDGIEDGAQAIVAFTEQLAGAEAAGILEERRGILTEIWKRVLDPTPGNIFS